MIKKLTIMVLLFHMAAYGMIPANDTATSARAESAAAAEIVLTADQQLEFKDLAQIIENYNLLNQDDRDAIDNRLGILPEAPLVMRLKKVVADEKRKIEEAARIKQQRLLYDQARKEANNAMDQLVTRRATLQRVLATDGDMTEQEREEFNELIEELDDTSSALKGETVVKKNRPSGNWWKPAGLSLVAVVLAVAGYKWYTSRYKNEGTK